MKALFLGVFALICTTMVFASPFCDSLQLEIEHCTLTDEGVYVQAGPTSLARNYIYTFSLEDGERSYQGARGITNTRFKDAEFLVHGDALHFFWPTDAEPFSVKVFHPECVGDAYIFTRKECSSSISCDTSIDCPASSHCSGGFCEPLECSPCERLEDHRCVQKCIDDSPCTQDTCNADGSCSFTPIEDCCEYERDCNDGLVCTQEACNTDTLRCERSTITCDQGACLEPTGCLNVENQWESSATSALMFRFQRNLILHPNASFLMFASVLGILVVLIFVQTRKDFKRFVVNRKKGRFVEPHKKKKTL